MPDTPKPHSAARLVDAVEALRRLVASYYSVMSADPPAYPTADDFGPVRESHARCIGLAAPVGLPVPPLDGCGLEINEREAVGVAGPDGKPLWAYRTVVPGSVTATRAWLASLGDLLTAARAMAEGGAARHAADAGDVLWSQPDQVQRWAKVWGVSRRVMAQLLRAGVVRSRKVNRQTYSVAIDDIPAAHRARFLPPG
jgi:hypothetical protein